MTKIPYHSDKTDLGEGESGSENNSSSAYSKLESDRRKQPICQGVSNVRRSAFVLTHRLRIAVGTGLQPCPRRGGQI